MPLRCVDWPTGQDLLKQAWLEGHLANGEAVNLFAEECAEGTLVICSVKRTSAGKNALGEARLRSIYLFGRRL